MSTVNEHRTQAEHNQSYLETIGMDTFPDWAATTIFYTAVHLTQMMFGKLGGRGGSHRRRNDTLRSQYPDVWKHYQPLYAHSRLARYWCMKVAPEHVPYLKRRLGRLKRAVNKRMAD